MLQYKNIEKVVIIGASEDLKKIGNILLEKNQSFHGEIYGVNPKGGRAYGRDFFSRISDLPCIPDIAVFAIPAPLIAASLEEAGEWGIRMAIIITAGFKEVGNIDGETEIQEIAKKYGIRILGPNCLGYGDTSKGLNLSFGGRFFTPGNIGIISQSGAMAVAITDVLASRGLGFSQFFSLGNKSDIDESDLLLELLADENTHTIALYLEGVARGEYFIQTLRKVTAKKRVIVMMGGMSDRGKVATASHTGSLSGGRATYEAALRQGGAILTYSLADFFELIEASHMLRTRVLHGHPYLITNAGGPGVLATDQAEFHHLELATITGDMDTILREDMPSMMSTRNPIDIIGDADSVRVAQILENIRRITDTADIIFIFTVQATTDIDAIAEVIADYHRREKGFTILVTLIGGDTVIHAREILRTSGISVSGSPESVISLYSYLCPESMRERSSSQSHHPSGDVPVLMDQNLTEKLLGEYAIPSTGMIETDTLESILAHMEAYQAPYIMKVAGKSLAHKTELGGIIGPISTQEEVESAFSDLTHKSGGRVAFGRYIEKNPSIELFFGAKRDPNFGDIFIIGVGGIYLSLHDDSRLHIGTWNTRDEIVDTLESLRFAPALFGYRNQDAIEIDAFIDMIMALTRLFHERIDIQEIDINPILFDNGAPVIADAKFYI